MKKLLITTCVLVLLYACSDSGKSDNTEGKATSETTDPATAPATESSDKGIGKFTDVKIDPTLNTEMATKGQNVYDVKCSACHKLTDEKLVGPGWKGVTSRHKPEWIMNFISNPDPMIDKDPAMQAQLELCLVRMPNQNLTGQEPRQILEFMRQNDGVK